MTASPRRAAGFTLLELLVAMTVLGVLTGLLATGLSFGTRVWEREHNQLEEWAELQMVQDVIRRTLGEAWPLDAPTSAGTEDGTGGIEFVGTETSVEFVGPPPAQSLVGGVYQYGLLSRSGPGGVSLVLTWRLRDPEATQQKGKSSGGARARRNETAAGASQSETAARGRQNETAARARRNETAARARQNETAASARRNETAARARLTETAARARQNETAASARRNETAARARQNETAASARRNETAEGKEVVLLDRLVNAEFSYFGGGDEEVKPRWRDRWRDASKLPLLVRVQVTFPPGDRRRWPELVIAPAITGTIGEG
jgi:general secretion pathway protein J